MKGIRCSKDPGPHEHEDRIGGPDPSGMGARVRSADLRDPGAWPAVTAPEMHGSRLRRWARDPLFVFLLIGASIFAVHGFLQGDESRTVTVAQAEIDRMARLWEIRTGGAPSDAELKTLIDDYVREEILVREAKRLRLDEGDVIVRRRLARKLSFLTEDGALSDPPGEAALKRFFEDNRSRYETPATITFSHVWFNPDRREDAAGDASRALSGLDPAAWRTAGDPFMLGHTWTRASLERVRRDFGAPFAETLVAMPADAVWRGPLESGYGVHLVRVDASTPAQEGSYESVAERVAADFDAERREEIGRVSFEALKSRYTIELP